MPSALLLRILFWLWLGGAVAAGHLQLLQRLPPTGFAILILALAGLAVIACLRLPALREWIDAVDLRSLILLHAVRFVGIHYLLLYHRGILPREFALSAGIGHVIIAAMALPVAFAPLEPGPRLRAISIWNVAGFADLILVIATMTRLNVSEPLHLLPLMRLPLSLAPTFLMPLLLATHVIIHLRVAQARRT